MFTGLIESIGKVEQLQSKGNYTVITIASSIDANELSIGESIACDGSCLTIVEKAVSRNRFVVEASQETVARTVVSRYAVGSKINLERALQVGDRLGGHFVTGHVDDTGRVGYAKQVGDSLELAIKYDARFAPYLVGKGSVAVMGVSLTVNRCDSGWFTVNLIPHTMKKTNLTGLKTGDPVNLEFDLIGKYIVKMNQAGADDGLSLDTLTRSGW